MTFHPDGSITDGNATLVASIDSTTPLRDLSAIERHWAEDDPEYRSLDRLMRSRSSVCG